MCHVSYGRMIIATRLLVKQHNQNARLVLKFLTTRILDLTEAATWTEVGHHTMLPPQLDDVANCHRHQWREDSISPMISEMNHASHLEERRGASVRRVKMCQLEDRKVALVRYGDLDLPQLFKVREAFDDL
jgi:hypothetical protein